MPYYYAYHVDDAGRRAIRRFELHADHDEQALEKAKQRLADRDIEVWCFERKVALIKRED
jgi:hypothetical protein